MARKPWVFIGSSTEGLRVAEKIQALLSKHAEARLWTKVFGPSKTFIESLMEEAEKADFAVLVMTGDDVTVSRKKKSPAPRDNVLYELGLFTGRLDRERCYFVVERRKNLKLPTDLSGVAALTYQHRRSETLEAALEPACSEIGEQISKLGRRPKLDKSALAAHQQFSDFCDGIIGHWWERVKPVGTVAISFITVERDAATNTVKLRGRGYDRDGILAAPWDSVASCINVADRKVFYYWKGSVVERPGEPYEGFGEIAFRESAGGFDSGDGVFSDTNLTDLKGTTKKSGVLRRSTPQEVAEMRGGDAQISSLIQKKLLEKW